MIGNCGVWSDKRDLKVNNVGPIFPELSSADVGIQPPDSNNFIDEQTPNISKTVQDTGSGIDPSSIYYEYSTNSGQTYTTVVGDNFNDSNIEPYWSLGTVGTVEPEYEETNSRLTIKGGGKLWNDSDNYTIVYTTISGNFTAITQIASMDYQSNNFNKAGLMVRNSFTQNSLGYCFVGISAEYGYMFEYDSGQNPGYLDSRVNIGAFNMPCWLKIVKSGTNFTGYYSSDGTNWVVINSGGQNITNATSSQIIGMAIGNKDLNNKYGVSFDSITINTNSDDLTTCTGSFGSQAVETITAYNVPFNNESTEEDFDQNRIRFKIYDIHGIGSTSPDYIVKISAPDSTPPNAVNNLAVNTGNNTGEAVLTFSSPGDDGATNNLVGKYKIQYSTYTGVVWSTASASIEISTSNVAPGLNQTITILGFTQEGVYYFRVWAADEIGNYSGISNGATWFMGVRPFVSTIKQSGGDFSSLSTWANAVKCNLTSAGTKVFSHSTGNNGGLSSGDAVTGQSSGATGTVVFVTSTQVLLKNISGAFASGESIKHNSDSHAVTINSAGYSAIAEARIEGDWTTLRSILTSSAKLLFSRKTV